MSSFDEDLKHVDPLELPLDLAERAFEIYGETTALRKRKLEELKELISELPEEDRIEDLSDLNLIRFLRGRKFDVGHALRTTINLVRFNREHPEWVEGHSAREFMYFNTFFQVLKATDKGRVICVFRPSIGVKLLTPEFIKAHPLAIIRSMIWFMNKMSFNVHAQVCGGLLLESFEGFTMRDNLTVAQACPLNQQIAAMMYVQNCVGFRFCGAYLFHEPSFITWLWYLARGFLNERVRNRFHLCGADLHRVHAEVDDIRILPVYYGGEVRDGDYEFVAEQARLEEEAEQRQKEEERRKREEDNLLACNSPLLVSELSISRPCSNSDGHGEGAAAVQCSEPRMLQQQAVDGRVRPMGSDSSSSNDGCYADPAASATSTISKEVAEARPLKSGNSSNSSSSSSSSSGSEAPDDDSNAAGAGADDDEGEKESTWADVPTPR